MQGTLHRASLGFAAGALLVVGAACGSEATPPDAGVRAPITISAVLTAAQQATIAGMSVEVTGPGITTPIIATLNVAGATVNGTVQVPVGNGRTFTVRAFDAQGNETYNGSATATVVAGTNPPLTVRMAALEGNVPINVTIATYGVTLTPATASVTVNGEVTLTANATTDGASAPGPLTWGVVNPALVTLTVAGDGRSAVVRGRIAGATRVVASFQGVAAAATVTVTTPPPENLPPVARANGPYAGKAAMPIAFSSAGSSDPDGTIASYAWAFGDGTTSTQASPTKMYASAGTYSVTLTVTDERGATATSTTTASVSPENVSPTVSIGGPYIATVGVPVTFVAIGGDTDGTVVRYQWLLSNELQPVSTTTGSLTRTFSTPGTYSVSVAAVDNDGAIGESRSTSVTVNAPPANQPPTVAIGGLNIVTAGVLATFTATGADVDGTVVQYRWAFSDTPGTTTTTTGSITHTFATPGSYTVSVTAVDDDGALSQERSRIITVNPPTSNQPPFVNINGPYTGLAGSPIQFTSNGTGDPDGVIVQYDWTFGDGGTSGLQFPTHVYASAGTYTVTLTVRDNGGATTTRTTTATVNGAAVNQPPTVSIQPQFFGFVGQPMSIFAGCSDPEGRPIAQWLFVFSNSTQTYISTTGTIQQTFLAAGNYQVAVACMDDRGALSPSRSAIITINP